ncbi:sugar ABC transporter permease [Lysobacter concretionis Ko07 = DSM 16239]|uniref:Transport permease protein n=1 Tax=Lysobacter concretionis Ko07 = DSM 16239 TaxID=1122185 RepID=A0A0A0EPP0_9GAMM|nr:MULTISPECIES: ABC transporter permease [Lysobacter]KGM52941.1 sugar ABC transporter permease [Lysobacter concretionis Ko07 = DSM 16239]
MNPHASQPGSLVHMVETLWRNRGLLGQMAKRDVVGRYKGAAIGVAWSFLTPLLMLCVYTFVFSVVFQARWGGDLPDGRAHFALIMFVGMLVHALFSEVVNRAPGLILSNPNYVKKVVFPLEVLPAMVMGSALFHACVSVLILLVALLILDSRVEWTLVFLPLILAPLVVLTLGVAWFLASLGVYVRDVSQVTTIMTTVMLFLAPIFYPITALPESFRWIVMVNPLTFIIEQTRDVLIWGRLPNFTGLGLYMLVALVIAWGGFFWFQKTRKGFADVL